MTFKEACQALGLSRSTFQRRIKAGDIKATKSGEGKFAALFFDPADLGLTPVPQPPTPAPSKVAEVAAQPEPEKANNDGMPVELDDLSTEELQAGIEVWRLPADPQHGVPTNAPHAHSSTMPTPENFARYTRALAILELRSFAGFTPPRVSRLRFNPSPVMGEGTISQYRPKTGFGVSEADLRAESDLLKAHPQFERNRYAR
jgi:excisionase family DNA binding protein